MTVCVRLDCCWCWCVQITTSNGGATAEPIDSADGSNNVECWLQGGQSAEAVPEGPPGGLGGRSPGRMHCCGQLLQCIPFMYESMSVMTSTGAPEL